MKINPQNLSKFSNKKISTSIGIFIIVLVAIIAGGIMAWQYGWLMGEREGMSLKTVPSDWTPLPEFCTKNEDCGTDFCQQKGDKCIEIKYICENEKCFSTIKEFSNYTCENKKCKEIKENETVGKKEGIDKEIKEIGGKMACDRSRNPDNCYNFVESLFKNPMPLEIINSEEKLKEYFKTGLDHLYFGGINRGRLDKYLEQEIITVFLKSPGHMISKREGVLIIIIQEETKDVWQVKEVEVYGDTEFRIQPMQLVKNEPPFFIAKDTYTGGTCVPVQWSIRIYRLENNKFKPIWDTMYYINGCITNQEQAEYTPEYMEIKISYKDLGNDGNLEIIKEGYWKLCKGEYACYESDCTEIIKEEKIYEVFKWDVQKQTFVEESIE